MKLLAFASGVAIIGGTGNAIVEHSVAVGMVSVVFLFLLPVVPREVIRWKRKIAFWMRPKTVEYYQAQNMVRATHR